MKRRESSFGKAFKKSFIKNAFAEKHFVKKIWEGKKEKNENENRNVCRNSNLYNAAGISGAC